MNEKKNFIVKDEHGNDVVCEPLFTFESEETNKEYIVYTDNSKDDKGNIRIFASIYKVSDKGKELLPIKTDKEWKVVETVLEAIQEESKKMGE